MNEGILIIANTGIGWELDPKIGKVIQAQIWADGVYNALNDEIMESDGVTLQQIFFGDYPGPGAGPVIPMDPVPPEEPVNAIDIYIPIGRLFEAIDVRMFEAIDNRIFEA